MFDRHKDAMFRQRPELTWCHLLLTTQTARSICIASCIAHACRSIVALLTAGIEPLSGIMEFGAQSFGQSVVLEQPRGGVARQVVVRQDVA
jgi:hypothetical protein